MRLFIFFGVLLIVSCGNPRATQGNEQLAVQENQKSSDVKLEDGVYYAYKFCPNKQERCKILSPQFENNEYYLKRYEDPKQDQYYIITKNNENYIYSMEYVSEDVIAYWSSMEQGSPEKLDFKINIRNQFIGSPDGSITDRIDIENTEYNKKGTIRIGDLPLGNIDAIKQIISLKKEGNDYIINCDIAIKSLTELNTHELAEYGGYFNYPCSGSEKIYFKKVF